MITISQSKKSLFESVPYRLRQSMLGQKHNTQTHRTMNRTMVPNQTKDERFKLCCGCDPPLYWNENATVCLCTESRTLPACLSRELRTLPMCFTPELRMHPACLWSFGSSTDCLQALTVPGFAHRKTRNMRHRHETWTKHRKRIGRLKALWVVVPVGLGDPGRVSKCYVQILLQ